MLSEKSYLKRKISLAEENNSTKSNKGAARVFNTFSIINQNLYYENNETDMVSKEINRFVMEAIIKYRSPSIIVIKKVCTSVNFFFFVKRIKRKEILLNFPMRKKLLNFDWFMQITIIMSLNYKETNSTVLSTLLLQKKVVTKSNEANLKVINNTLPNK